MNRNNEYRFEYVGNLHIHSIYSDGAATVASIAKTGNKLDLDFIAINDHDYMTDTLHLEDEGFYNGTLVLMGLELGTRYHHYLAYGLKETVKGGNLGPQEVIDLVNSQSGFGFLAHPFEKGMPFAEKAIAYTWNDLTVDGYTGICIWNFSSRWKERIKSPFHGVFFLFFKKQTLKGPSRKTLLFWDKLCQKKRISAIGGSDAHATFFRWGMIKIRPSSYKFLLNSINVHVLLNKQLPTNLSGGKAEIYGALKEGRLFIAHENIASAKGFRFDYISSDGLRLTMGQETKFKPGVLLVKLPDKGQIRILKDGILKKQWRGKRAVYKVEHKGVYRVEVYHRLHLFGWRPWIFSNPIYLR